MKKKNHIAEMQLDYFEVIHSELSEKLEGKGDDLKVGLEFQPLRSEDDGDEQLGLKVCLDINKRRRDVKLKGSFEATAIFSFTNSLEPQTKFRMLLYNGLAIVYGLFRGIVFQKASSIPPNLRLLPALNIVKLVDEEREKFMVSRDELESVE